MSHGHFNEELGFLSPTTSTPLEVTGLNGCGLRDVENGLILFASIASWKDVYCLIINRVDMLEVPCVLYVS